MTDMDTLFKKRKIRFEQLLSFGFSKRGDAYVYTAGLAGGQFEMTVKISKDGKMLTEVVDGASREGYVLHRVPGVQGAFVGAVREEYEAVLAAVAKACTEPDVFKSEEARRIIAYVREKYRSELEFLWKRFSDNAILRRQDTAKWYAALLILPKIKLGLNEPGLVEIIDLRSKPENIVALVDGKKYFPGYHMNKKHWFAICLDGSVPVEEIFARIDESFTLAVK